MTTDTRVLDTRLQKSGEVRRRRQCCQCTEKFSTLECLITKSPWVIKKNGPIEPFNKAKLRKGIELACQKRPVTLDKIEKIIHSLSTFINSHSSKEISSHEIGKQVMRELKTVDHVAFVRFASVYRTFDDISEFVKSLEEEPSHNRQL